MTKKSINQTRPIKIMEQQQFYHIYNRGNNRQAIFMNRANYLFFLKKIRKHMLPHLHIVAYCLMPNHFHLLVYGKDEIVPKKFSNDLRVMLRSYTRAINKQENRTGSLFQQHSKIKPMDEDGSSSMAKQASSSGHPFICFHYIHQNPVKAGLVSRMEQWEFSSFRDYAGIRNGTLCNKTLAYDLLEVPKSPGDYLSQSYEAQVISDKVMVE